jgi:hypothetical protein
MQNRMRRVCCHPFAPARVQTDRRIFIKASQHGPDIVRRFSVYARHIGLHHTRVIAENSFQAAAVAYVEDQPHDLVDQNDVHVIVCDLDTGQEHCFRIHLDVGASLTNLS